VHAFAERPEVPAVAAASLQHGQPSTEGRGKASNAESCEWGPDQWVVAKVSLAYIDL
jgi:hypothetical protein